MLQSGAATTAAAADGLIKETTTQTFVKDVIEESKRQPVLIDFWAPWCGPCKQLTPILEKAVKAAKGKVKLVKMNIDEHPAIPGQMGIQSIPAVIAFVNGQPADGFMGALPESQVMAFLERLTKDKIGGRRQGSAQRRGRGAGQEGLRRPPPRSTRRCSTEDGASIPALAGLARCYVGDRRDRSGQADAWPWCRKESATIPRSRPRAPRIELAEQSQSLGPVDELEQKVAANPADHQARFDLALALNAKGAREAALDHLMEIVKRDRKWNDDGARKQLVQFFDAWGPTDEATISGRKRLSSILFS